MKIEIDANTLSALVAVLDYLWQDESWHYEENALGDPTHIGAKLVIIRNLIVKLDPARAGIWQLPSEEWDEDGD